MTFFKTDLARNLGIGFVVGTVLTVVANPAFAHALTSIL